MATRKTVMGLAIVVGAVGAYLLAALDEKSEQKAPMPEPAGTYARTAPKTPRQAAPRTPSPAFNPMPVLPALPGRANPFAAVPTDNVITFDVKSDGTAVAFGDVVLGKVEEGWHGTQGRFDTPVPQLWDKPEIPYSVSPDLANPSRVEQTVAYFRDHTPIRLVPYNGQPDAVVFETGDENCLSALGRVGGLQPIKLSPQCQPPQIIHEVMHALGFVHEQSRPDRDRYVQIQWDNIQEQYQDQFAMVSEAFTEAERGSSFDYRSVMLYRPDLFAVSSSAPTMKPTGSEAISPVNDGLSPEDVRRLNQLYGQ